MTADHLAAVLHMRDVAYRLNDIVPNGPPVIPSDVLADLDDLIAQERMTARLLPREAIDRFNAEPVLHSVRADSELYDDCCWMDEPCEFHRKFYGAAGPYSPTDPTHPDWHDQLADIYDMREGK